MYAEQFSVRPWLEEPAKWLQWTAYGLSQQADLGTVYYNLQQFWNALNDAKTRAQTQQDWGEIESLDAQGQFNYKRYCVCQQSAALKKLNDYAALSGFSGGVSAFILTGGLSLAFPSAVDSLIGWANGKDATAQALAQTAKDWGNRAIGAAQAFAQLGAKAKADLQAAGAPLGQAGNAADLGPGQISLTKNEVASYNQTGQNILGNPNPLDFFGVPWWVWAAGIGTLAVVLLASEGPSVARAVKRTASRGAKRYAKTAKLAAVLL